MPKTKKPSAKQIRQEFERAVFLMELDAELVREDASSHTPPDLEREYSDTLPHQVKVYRP